jgi:hypothetical protein
MALNPDFDELGSGSDEWPLWADEAKRGFTQAVASHKHALAAAIQNFYSRLFSSLPAPVPLYFELLTLKW